MLLLILAAILVGLVCCLVGSWRSKCKSFPLWVVALLPLTFPTTCLIPWLYSRKSEDVWRTIMVLFVAGFALALIVVVRAILKSREADLPLFIAVRAVCVVWMLAALCDALLLPIWYGGATRNPKSISPDGTMAVLIVEVPSLFDADWKVVIISPRAPWLIISPGSIESDSWVARGAVTRWSEDSRLFAVYDGERPLFAYGVHDFMVSGERLPIDVIAWKAQHSNTWNRVQMKFEK